MGETELRARIVELLSNTALFLKAHPDSRRDHESDPGFPDMVIAGPGGVLYRELKDPYDTLSQQQLAWRDVLLASGQDWAIWRPADLLGGRIERELLALGSP